MRYFWFTLSVIGAAAAALTVSADEGRFADLPPGIDRRPGILEEPSEVPTGDQAYLYEDLGVNAPDSQDSAN